MVNRKWDIVMTRLIDFVLSQQRGAVLGVSVIAIMSTAHLTPSQSSLRDIEPIVVTNVLDQPGFPLTRILGVCEITAESAKCWDSLGKPLNPLADRIIRYHQEQEYPSLSIRPGVKNRWVVMESANASEDDYHLAYTEPGNYAGAISDWRPGTTLSWSRLDAPDEDKHSRLICNYRKGMPPERLAVKKGAKVDIDGTEISVTAFGRRTTAQVKADQTSFMGPLRYQITVKRSERDPARARIDEPIPISMAGRQIVRVDGNGKPMAAGWERTDAGVAVYVTSNAGPLNAQTYSLNVDPQYVAHLQFSMSAARKVIFEEILLDPATAFSGK
ncbi:hypothetical protein MCEMSE15_02476 [Fimbriimonadaceae bacterium]